LQSVKDIDDLHLLECSGVWLAVSDLRGQTKLALERLFKPMKPISKH